MAGATLPTPIENLLPLALRREFMTDPLVNTVFRRASINNETREAALIAAVAMLVQDRERLQEELLREVSARPPAPLVLQQREAPGHVHIVHLGSALCGKPGPPGNWFDGDRWVPLLGDDPRNPRSAVTCTGCLRSAEQRGPDGYFMPEPEAASDA